MMKELLRIVVLCLLLPAELVSCVKDVIMDAKEKPQVAVVCILSDDPVQELRLSFTKGASLKEAPPLLEAEAYLKDLTAWDELMMFERQEDGVWRLDYAAVPGHKYRLEVIVPGYEPLWAEDTMPDKIRSYLQRWYWFYDKVESPTGYHEFGGPGELVIVDGGIWEDGEDLPKGETFFGVAELNNPVWIYAMNYNPVSNRREIVEEICTEYTQTDSFNLTGEAYKSPQWEEPIPYNVWPWNEELLANTHIKALYPFLDGSLMHRRYLRLSPVPAEKFTDGNGIHHPLGFGISGNFSGEFNCPDNFMDRMYHRHWGFVRDLAEEEGYVVWTAVSEAFDKYLKDAYQTMELQSSTDLTTIYLRDNMPSNIRQGNGSSGLGLFGCMLERKYQWSSEGTYIDYDRSYDGSRLRTYHSFQDVLDSHGFFIPMEERKELYGY